MYHQKKDVHICCFMQLDSTGELFLCTICFYILLLSPISFKISRDRDFTVLMNGKNDFFLYFHFCGIFFFLHIETRHGFERKTTC